MLIWNQQEPPPPVAYEISYGEVDVRLDPHFNEGGSEIHDAIFLACVSRCTVRVHALSGHRRRLAAVPARRIEQYASCDEPCDPAPRRRSCRALLGC